ERGDIFYRVEPGESFVVAAPGAEILVTGTCFRVEVEPMLKPLVSAAAGAIVASAIVVTVYEGKVRVVSAEGATEVHAGEQTRLGKPAAAAPEPVAVTFRPPPLRDEDLKAMTRDQLAEQVKHEH